MKHKLMVTRVFRVVRTVEMEVEAETADQAIEMVHDGTIEPPDWGHWNEVDYRLENEEIESA